MRRLLLVAIMVVATTFAMAQENMATNVKASTPTTTSKSGYMSFSFDVRTGGALAQEYREFSIIDIEASFGYHFNNRWSLHVPFTASTGLFYNSSTFTEQLYLGLSGEFKAVERNRWSFIIAPKVQSTLGDKWGAMAYDLGFKVEWSDVPVNVGIGARFIDTYSSPIATSPIQDKILVYVSIGIRFNSLK